MKSTYHIPNFIQYDSYQIDTIYDPAPFNSAALYYENDEYISFDVNHQILSATIRRS